MISVSVDDKELRKWLGNVKAKLSNMSIIYTKAAAIMERDIVGHFAEKVDSENKPWPGLSKNYHPTKGDLLQRSGYLRNSIWKRFSSENAEVKTSQIYAAIHNFGGIIPQRKVAPRDSSVLAWSVGGKTFFSKGHTIPPTRIPKREFMYISDNGISKIIQMITNEIPD